MQIVINLAMMVGLVTLLFLSPACMNVGLVRVSNQDFTITKPEFVLCCIPVFNHFYGWKKYSGKSLSMSGISEIIVMLMFIFRTVVMFFFFDNATLQTVSVLVFLGSIVLFWILSAVNIYSVLNDTGIYTLTSKVMYAFTIVVGQIVVGYYMPRRMYHYTSKKKGTLYGRD